MAGDREESEEAEDKDESECLCRFFFSLREGFSLTGALLLRSAAGVGDAASFFFLPAIPFVLAVAGVFVEDLEDGGGVTESRGTGGVGVDLGDGEALLLVGDVDRDLLETARGDPFLFFTSLCFAPFDDFLPFSSWPFRDMYLKQEADVDICF